MLAEKFVLGTWGLSGPVCRQGKIIYYGNYDENESLAIFTQAWKMGIRYVDTALSYGDGNGYSLLRKWTQHSQQQFFLIIKIGRPIEHDQPVNKFKYHELIHEITHLTQIAGQPHTILIKDPPADFLTSRYFDALLFQLENQYPTCKLGFASHLIFDCLQLKSQGERRIAQIEYNGINYPQANRTIAYLKANNWKILSMQPLAYGYLSGQYTENHIFPSHDWRHYLHSDKKNYLTIRAKQFFSHFISYLQNYNHAQIAIGFCLVNKNINKIIIGPKTVKQLMSIEKSIALAKDLSFIAICDSILNKHH